MSEVHPTEALRSLEREALQAISHAADLHTLEEARIAYLGRKDGRISLILRTVGTLAPEERPAVGQEANRVKERVTEALEARERDLAGPAGAGCDDLTLPGRGPWKGTLHPITQVVDEIWGIFRDLGFTRARGPEADTEWYNFVALNTPLDPPAADEQDTL